MAFKRIKDLTDGTLGDADTNELVNGELAVDPTTGNTRKFSIYDIYEMMGLTIWANLAAAPSPTANYFVYIKAVRKEGEVAGKGTGAVCRGDGVNWRLWSNNSVAVE